MAAAVRAELKLTDGQSLRLGVPVQSQLSSLIAAVHELSVQAARLLNDLVEGERAHGTRAQGEEEEEDEDDSDEEPEVKRSKT